MDMTVVMTEEVTHDEDESCNILYPVFCMIHSVSCIMSALLQANKKDVFQDLCSSNGHFPKERLARALRYLGSNPTQQQVIFSKIERNKRLNCPPTSVEPLYVPLSYYTKNQ